MLALLSKLSLSWCSRWNTCHLSHPSVSQVNAFELHNSQGTLLTHLCHRSSSQLWHSHLIPLGLYKASVLVPENLFEHRHHTFPPRSKSSKFRWFREFRPSKSSQLFGEACQGVPASFHPHIIKFTIKVSSSKTLFPLNLTSYQWICSKSQSSSALLLIKVGLVLIWSSEILQLEF